MLFAITRKSSRKNIHFGVEPNQYNQLIRSLRKNMFSSNPFTIPVISS